MSDYLCISVTLLDERFHGRADGGAPEWPPSPLRLFQAMVAANATQADEAGQLQSAMEWLESQPPPVILAPSATPAAPYCLSVPNNAMDIVGRAWSRGVCESKDSQPATHRTMKDVRPVRISDAGQVHYVWPIGAGGQETPPDAILQAARRLYALGWGIDMAVADACLITRAERQQLLGEQWQPSPSHGGVPLRVTMPGTLSGLQARHTAYLDRIEGKGFSPVKPLTKYDVAGYRRADDPVGLPCVVVQFRHDDDRPFYYAQRKLIELAGMVRHAAIQAMRSSPPSGVPDDWVQRYVAGHRNEQDANHLQLSYVPLPSIGHPHADHALRRVMIIAPPGDDRLLQHLVSRLQGVQLEPERGDEFGGREAPVLHQIRADNVVRCYTTPANRWASVTPVILPGHNDRKAAKTIKLIERSLREAGIQQPCDFEWSPVSRFAKSLASYKTDRNGRPLYIRPSYLQNLSAVHLTLTFRDGLEVPGPIAIGAGRHCGFGLMAQHPESAL